MPTAWPGGADFAFQWTLAAFKGGVTPEVLVRRPELTEIERKTFQVASSTLWHIMASTKSRRRLRVLTLSG